MTIANPPTLLMPIDVERAGERDGKNYELVDGELKEKQVGSRSLFIASLICGRLNAFYYPHAGFAVVEAMIYCFKQQNRGRKPDVVYVNFDRLPIREIPEGDLFIAPNLVVEVLSPGNTGIEMGDKLEEYLDAGVPMVWMVYPDRRGIRLYRSDGTTKAFRVDDVIENESLLPGFRLPVAEIFPTGAPPIEVAK